MSGALRISRDDALEVVRRRRAESTDDKAAMRVQLAAQTAEYLARGGQIEQAVSTPISCEVYLVHHANGYNRTVRRWVEHPAPVTDVERVVSAKRRMKMGDIAKATRRPGQRVVLPGSHTGPKPT